MHLVRPEVAAYHTYTWMEPGLKVRRDTETWVGRSGQFSGTF